MRLFISTDVSGGQYAAWAKTFAEAVSKILKARGYASRQEKSGVPTWETVNGAMKEGLGPVWGIRLAPQDVVDWVRHKARDDDDWARVKQPGGWVYTSIVQSPHDNGGCTDRPSAAFIPIPLTANLTVINPEDAPKEQAV